MPEKLAEPFPLAAGFPTPNSGTLDQDPIEMSEETHLVAGKYAYQLVHIFECHARSSHHASERIFRNNYRQPGFFHEQTVNIAQQRAATGQHHAFFSNIGAQFGQGMLQCGFDRADNAIQGISQRFEDFVARNGEAARDSFGKIAALDFHFAHFGTGNAEPISFLISSAVTSPISMP